ncbi:COQ9 family protein [Paracoccaceae bacterium]
MEPENTVEHAKDRVLAAALAHVPFDGWSEATLTAAIADSGVAPGLARALFPRGGVDLAAAWHRQGNRAMAEALAGHELAALRFRDRVALAVMLRLQAADRECVRRGSALFALPQHAAEGAGLIWGTADAIWTALGDTSRDLNWYTKRATLSAVFGSTVLYWLGDTSEGDADTRAFLDRRIETVMQIEKAKAGFRANPLGKALLQGPLAFLDRLQAPQGVGDLPGHTSR